MLPYIPNEKEKNFGISKKNQSINFIHIFIECGAVVLKDIGLSKIVSLITSLVITIQSKNFLFHFLINEMQEITIYLISIKQSKNRSK